jgi:hypothetical protein
MARGSPGRRPGLNLAPAALLLVFLAGGCSPKTGTVSGKVTYEGDVVPGGFVDFIPETGPEKGTVFSSTIDGGKYRVTGMPLGPAKVLIRHPGEPPTRLPRPAPRKPYPKRYATPEGSDLKCTVAGGRQEYNIDLKP